ncbi:MAG TPA: hypothetical protein VIK10_00450 [Prolixibacteraceae bacterium]
MKKKKILLLFGLLLFIVWPSSGQNPEALQDTGFVKKPVFISVLNLRPVTLNKQRILFSLQAEYPEYYKYFNPQSGKTERVSESTALNEAYYFGHIVYGFTDRINLFAIIPVTSIHHYSPSATIIGKGFGDFALGGIYSLVESKNFENSLTSGITVGFPTGKYKNIGSNDYPLGLGAYKFKGDVTGLHRFKNLDMMYSVYYEYRTNNSQGLNIGDEAGAYITFQKQIKTDYGNFGLEGGAYGTYIPHTDDYSANLFVGAWYNYLKDFDIRVGVPYSIYQNKSWLTKYEVLIQLDYYFDLKKTK